MSKLRVHSFAISIDGYGAGPNQDLNNPLGVGGMALHEWVFGTRTFRQMLGKDGGTRGIDDDFVARGFDNIGAWIIGRNMFGPVRGPWPDNVWKGWWGDNPPYHTPVFVLTHHPRASIDMSGGTTFYFVTEGIHAALERAVGAANGQDVRLGGGVATIRQYLRAGLIDEMHLAMSPILLGSGECLLEGIDAQGLCYQCTEHVPTPNATHFVITKRTQLIRNWMPPRLVEARARRKSGGKPPHSTTKFDTFSFWSAGATLPLFWHRRSPQTLQSSPRPNTKAGKPPHSKGQAVFLKNHVTSELRGR